jgi:hypothetical protein
MRKTKELELAWTSPNDEVDPLRAGETAGQEWRPIQSADAIRKLTCRV